MTKKILITLFITAFTLGCDLPGSQEILVKITNNSHQDLLRTKIISISGSKDFDRLIPGETGRFKANVDRGLHLTLIYSMPDRIPRTEVINRYFEDNPPDFFLISIDNSGKIKY